jgi:hypothetical protein
MGEGWHNNHRAYQASARQGFHWWEIDPTYYALQMLAWLGLVWNLRKPTCRVVPDQPDRACRSCGTDVFIWSDRNEGKDWGNSEPCWNPMERI